MTNQFAPGTLVAFKIADAGEDEIKMVVLEDNGNRVLIEDLMGWPINPTCTYPKSILYPIATCSDADASDLAESQDGWRN